MIAAHGISDSSSTLTDNILDYLQTHEQEMLHDLSEEVLQTLQKHCTPVAPGSEYALRFARLTRDCTHVEGHAMRFHCFHGEPDAFAIASGDICFFTGLMDILEDDELLFAVGHEIGHVVHEDVKLGMRAQFAAEAAGRLVSLVMERFAIGSSSAGGLPKILLGKLLRTACKKLVRKLATSIVTGVTHICYSRIQEYDADAYGIRFLHARGLDPGAAAKALDKLAGGYEACFIEKWTSDHPDTPDRITRLYKLAVELTAQTALR